jgi:hypothetical protein
MSPPLVKLCVVFFRGPRVLYQLRVNLVLPRVVQKRSSNYSPVRVEVRLMCREKFLSDLRLPQVAESN